MLENFKRKKDDAKRISLLADAAVEWWAKKISGEEPHDNGSNVFTSFAACRMADMGRKKITEKQLFVFKEVLRGEIKVSKRKCDCLELMNRIPDGSIDMVLSDLPYGTTRCRWDTPINLQELWKQYRRVVKENGAIVLFSAQPFTTELISSNKAMYRYEWIWRKTQPSGFMNAKKMPLRAHENIEIFYRKPPTYNPQMTHGHQRKTATAYGTRESDGSSCYGREERNYTYDSTDRYPVDVLQYSTGDKAKRLHPTQKPVDLLEYLVKTYTNPGETVLDNCMGAGSTGVACLNTGREFVGIELDLEYYQIAKERIEKHVENIF